MSTSEIVHKAKKLQTCAVPHYTEARFPKNSFSFTAHPNPISAEGSRAVIQPPKFLLIRARAAPKLFFWPEGPGRINGLKQKTVKNRGFQKPYLTKFKRMSKPMRIKPCFSCHDHHPFAYLSKDQLPEFFVRFSFCKPSSFHIYCTRSFLLRDLHEELFKKRNTKISLLFIMHCRVNNNKTAFTFKN